MKSTTVVIIAAIGDGGYTNGVYATEAYLKKVVAGTIILSTPDVTYLPDGVEFPGWAVGTPTEVQPRLGIDPMSFWVQSGETVLAPGSSYTVTDDFCLSARYKDISVSLANVFDNGEMLYTYNDKMVRSVTLTGRTLYKDGSWNTLCLPFNVTICGSPLDGDGVEHPVCKVQIHPKQPQNASIYFAKC